MSASDVVRLQSEQHPLAYSGTFNSKEEYISHLVHQKAYEVGAALAKGLTVLDFGCNNGYGTVEIARSANRVVGLDVSAAALEDARRLHGATAIEFLRFEGETIPFDAKTFDLVVSFQVIEHIYNTRSYLQEIARVLKPGGLSLFTTPNAVIRLDPGMKPWNPFHVREFSAAQLGETLREVFELVEVRGLFATTEVYSTEFARCQAALANARERLNSPRLLHAKTSNGAARTLIKAILPRPIADIIRRVVNPAGGAPKSEPLPADVLQRYSTRDFFYQDHDLDLALDLMAICRTTPSARNSSA